MKRSGCVVLVCVSLCVAAARGATATQPIDHTERNTSLAPTNTVRPDTRRPEIEETVQQKRVTPATIDKKPAAVGDRKSPLAIKETQEKTMFEKDIRATEKLEQPRSAFNQQRARISVSGDTTKPPMVAKYQDSLTASNAISTARLPAVSSNATAKINRFVFRKNGGELANTPQRATAVPAAGGSAPTK